MLVVINSTGVLVQTSRRRAACIVAFACSEMIAYWRPSPGRTGKRGPNVAAIWSSIFVRHMLLVQVHHRKNIIIAFGK